MRNLVLLLTTTFILGLLGCVAVEATFADAVASPPLRLAWSCTLALAPGQQAPQVNALVSVNTPVATVTLTGPDWEICLVGLSLDDGTVLWNNSGVEGTYQGQNYTVPYTNAAALRRDALVADFSRVVTLGNLVLAWKGFSLLDPKASNPSSYLLLLQSTNNSILIRALV
jgi:hypothetical protein